MNSKSGRVYGLALAFIMVAFPLFMLLFKTSIVLQKAFLFAIILLFSIAFISQHYDRNTIAKTCRVASWALIVVFGIFMFRSGTLEYQYLTAWGITLLLQMT